ncbi:MAG: AAA+-type ATPase [Stictis urceolatum]|nr:AAA+-type ATPase [Stictis urceolata]
MSEKQFTIRPFSKAERTDLKDALRVCLSSASMIQYKLSSGDLITIITQDGKNCPAIAWASTEKIQDTIAQTSRLFQELHGLRLGDKLALRREESNILEARTVEIAAISPIDAELMVEDEGVYWTRHILKLSRRAEMLTPGMIFATADVIGTKASFKIVKIDSNTSPGIYRSTGSTTVQIYHLSGDRTSNSDTLTISSKGICGIDQQVTRLNKRLQRLSCPPPQETYLLGTQSTGGGVLLHGPRGVGKTMILRRIQEAGPTRAHSIEASTATAKELQAIFELARKTQPSIITIDNVDYLEHPAILAHQLSRLADTRILVVGATRNLRALDERLLNTNTFDTALELPIPSPSTRGQILKALNSAPPDEPHPILDALVGQTYGFAGGDLERLTYTTRVFLEDSLPPRTPSASPDPSTLPALLTPPLSAFEQTLKTVRPSSMSTVHLSTPSTRWTDIGGAHATKHALRQAVEFPLKYPQEMTRLGIPPKKGLLLYGPPGCSKTLTAKAVATEAKLNFLAVKGAELLNMYVGESERAVREVFAKARAASPSVLFFDEVDSIGSTREGGAGTGGSGLNVLTTLLNELDGIEDLKGVFVLAATNKPQSLDPALMRPGRLDQLLYVGLPEKGEREEICGITLGRMATEEVEPAWLAERTEGYSGAEIVSVCTTAGHAAMWEAIEGDKMGVQKLEKRHLEQALAEVPKQITAEMIEVYERWGQRSKV